MNARGPLVIVYATLPEAAPLLATLAARALGARPYPVFVARLPGTARRLVVAVTGMGLAAADAGVERILVHETPGEIVNAGIAGALHPTHDVGAVLRIGAVAECDDDRIAAGSFVTLDPASVAWLAPPGGGVRLVSRATPVFDTALRDRLARDADLVDMEGARIAAGCARAGVPCALLKTISDRADTRAALHANLAHGARRLADHLVAGLRYASRPLAVAPGAMR